MEVFIKRLKSFLWRLGGAIVTFTLLWISKNIGLLELPLWIQGIVALAIGEITKWWNTFMETKGKTFFGRKR